MSIKNSEPSMNPYLLGSISRVRLLSESLSVVDAVPKNLEGGKARVRNQTTSTFELGVPLGEKATNFRVRLNYAVVLTLEEGGMHLGKYESKSEAFFQLLGKGGFDDWENVPTELMPPYFAMAHYLARQRAEDRLLKAGFNGIVLPIPDNLGGTKVGGEEGIETPSVSIKAKATKKRVSSARPKSK